MRIEIVTPAGRERYLEILYRHLKLQKSNFDQWTLWINTTHQPDIDYCKRLERENDWIRTIDYEIPPNSEWSIYSFFKYACDPKKIYIRLDDDIVWMEKDFVRNLSTFRYQNPEYFLVYGNIINNAVIDHLQQRLGNFKIKELFEYDSFGQNGWSNPQIAEQKHKDFMKAILTNDIEKFKFRQWILHLYERVSINCISWMGSEFEKFNGEVEHDEELYLSVIKPQELKKPNIIYGEAVCAHYAFFTQRPYLDENTDVLNKYKFISELHEKISN